MGSLHFSLSLFSKPFSFNPIFFCWYNNSKFHFVHIWAWFPLIIATWYSCTWYTLQSTIGPGIFWILEIQELHAVWRNGRMWKNVDLYIYILIKFLLWVVMVNCEKKNELNPSHYGLSSKSGVKGIVIDPTSETVNQILHQLLYNKSRREIMILPFKLVHSFSLAQIKWAISEKMKFVNQWLSICLILIIDFLSWALTFPFFFCLAFSLIPALYCCLEIPWMLSLWDTLFAVPRCTHSNITVPIRMEEDCLHKN